MVRSSGALNSSTRRIIAAPNASRRAQRRMLATQSLANTGVPSWNHNPSRSLIDQSV